VCFHQCGKSSCIEGSCTGWHQVWIENHEEWCADEVLPPGMVCHQSRHRRGTSYLSGARHMVVPPPPLPLRPSQVGPPPPLPRELGCPLVWSSTAVAIEASWWRPARVVLYSVILESVVPDGTPVLTPFVGVPTGSCNSRRVGMLLVLLA
jgi:hypothetical protein